MEASFCTTQVQQGKVVAQGETHHMLELFGKT